MLRPCHTVRNAAVDLEATAAVDLRQRSRAAVVSSFTKDDTETSPRWTPGPSVLITSGVVRAESSTCGITSVRLL